MSGCENLVRDTQYGELMMKLVRVLFSTTSKRHDSTEFEMLSKYLRMQYLRLVRTGFEDRKVDILQDSANVAHAQGKREAAIEAILETEASIKRKNKTHMANKTILATSLHIWKTNRRYHVQTLVLTEKEPTKKGSEPEEAEYEQAEGKDLNVHPTLKLVCISKEMKYNYILYIRSESKLS